jgi:hypothetical protein
VLVGIVSGSNAVELERKSDDDIVKAALHDLQQMFGQEPPKPVAMVTRWGSGE